MTQRVWPVAFVLNPKGPKCLEKVAGALPWGFRVLTHSPAAARSREGAERRRGLQQPNGWMDRRMGGRVDRWIDGWVSGWIGTQNDERMDGWVGR